MSDHRDPMADQHAALNAALVRSEEMSRDIVKKIITRPAVPLSDKPHEAVAVTPLDVETRRREFLTLRHDPRLVLADVEYEGRNLPSRLLPRRSVQRILDGLKEFGSD